MDSVPLLVNLCNYMGINIPSRSKSKHSGRCLSLDWKKAIPLYHVIPPTNPLALPVFSSLFHLFPSFSLYTFSPTHKAMAITAITDRDNSSRWVAQWPAGASAACGDKNSCGADWKERMQSPAGWSHGMSGVVQLGEAYPINQWSKIIINDSPIIASIRFIICVIVVELMIKDHIATYGIYFTTNYNIDIWWVVHIISYYVILSSMSSKHIYIPWFLQNNFQNFEHFDPSPKGWWYLLHKEDEVPHEQTHADWFHGLFWSKPIKTLISTKHTFEATYKFQWIPLWIRFTDI